MPTYTPAVSMIVSDIPTRDGGFLQSPPIAWQTEGEQLAVESGSYVTGNRISEKGELHGSYQPKLQDTYISGTGGRTGKAFTVTTGTVKDDWVSTRTSKYGLLIPKSTDTFDVVQTTPDARIVNTQFVVRRGANPVGNTPTGSNYYTYLHLAYGDVNQDYRIALVWGEPLRLDYYVFGAWQIGADVSKQISNLEAYLSANADAIAMDVVANYNDNTLTVRVGNRVALLHKPAQGLPPFGRTRLVGQYGWATYEEYPLRFQPVTVTKKARDFGQVMPVGSAAIVGNGRAYADPTQTHTASLTGNGQEIGYTLTASLPDAGDGLGSTDPPILSDVTLALPGVWVHPFPSTVFLPPAIRCDILETLDDASRTNVSSASVPVNNWNSRYTGSYGHVATDITLFNGIEPPGLAFSGVGGGGPRGIEFYRQDPMRLMTLPCSDNSMKMRVPIGEEICLDGYAWPTAFRLVAELGNVHPQFLSTLPFYVPPGASPDAPFGPAGDDWPGYSFGKGSGLNAKYRFLPNELAWDILCQLIQELREVDLVTGQAMPYYMGFDPYGSGQFMVQPYNPRFVPPKIAYLERDVTGYGQIEEIRVFNSIYQMRTSLDFQGIDAFTNELLYYHLNMPDAVMQAVGFRFPWLERSAKFASADYMVRIAEVAAVQAALPTQVVTVKVPYHPNVHVGDTCIIQESNALGGTGVFYITEMRHCVGLHVGGMGTADCYSVVTARSVNSPF